MRTIAARFACVTCALAVITFLLGSGCPPNVQLFTLHATARGPGSVDPTDSAFTAGTQVTVTATPDSDARFDHWEGDASGSQNPLSITMDSNKNITAVFLSGSSGSGGEGDITSGAFTVQLLAIQGVFLSDGTLSVAVPLRNTSSGAVQNVQITGIQLTGAQYLGPESLPVSLGDMAQGDIRVVNALFSAPTPTQATYPVTVSGTFQASGASSSFEIDGEVTPVVPDVGPIAAVAVTTGKLTAATATFPPDPTPPPPGFEFNEFFATGSRPPLGLFRNLFAAPPAASLLDLVKAFTPVNQPPPGGNSNAVIFTRNTLGTNGGGLPPDPTVAGADASGFAMYGVNTRVAFSTDFGVNFTSVGLTSGSGFNDPTNAARNAFFPQDDGGLCCDQVILYIPNRNIYVWLLQYNAAPIVLAGVNTTGPNRLRIAWATPQAAAADFLHAWTWIDITSAGVNIGNDWMDYPDLAYSDTFVYLGVDHGIQGTGNVKGNRHIFVRISLADMLNPNVDSVGYQYMEPTSNNLYQHHIVQSSADGMYWGSLPDTSTLKVYAWPDNSNSATSHDIAVSTWCNSDYTANAPDGLNWNTAPTNALGATRTDPSPGLCPPGQVCTPPHFLYFAWSAGRANPCTVGNPPQTITGRPFPYVRVAKVNLNDFTLVSELDIWNNDFAFATPALVSRPGSPIEEVAMSLATGGGGNYANNAVGFLGDFVVYVTTNSNRTQAANSGGSTVTRYGDYFDVRNALGPPTANGPSVGFSTLGYAVQEAVAGQSCIVGGCNITPHYVLFGRDFELFPSPPEIIH